MKKIIILILLLLILPLPSLAFNEDYIISDDDLLNYSSMDLKDIKNFLIDHGSYLAYYADFYPETGTFMEASEIIWRVAQQFKINPKFLLVMLEKEQSLISLKIPTQKRLDWSMGYGVCDRCELAHPLVAKNKGFAKQVYNAADRIINTYWADLAKYGETHTGMGPNISKKLDYKYWVTPKNFATAVLYTYTPHILGNKNFYTIWKRWFSNIFYPDGSLLQDAATGGIYLIQGGAKRPFLSYASFISRYNESSVSIVDARILEQYPDGAPIKFPDYSLLQDENGNLYMTTGDQIRPFESQEVFRSLGFQPFEIEEVTKVDLAPYQIGTPITIKSAYPTGGLLQNKKTGGVYWVYDGLKHPIWDRSLLVIFNKYQITQVDEANLNQFENSDPVKFSDGFLVKGSSPAVYIISDGKLRLIPSEDVFLAFDWKWENVIWTNDKVLSLYELGDPIQLENNSTLQLTGI